MFSWYRSYTNLGTQLLLCSPVVIYCANYSFNSSSAVVSVLLFQCCRQSTSVTASLRSGCVYTRPFGLELSSSVSAVVSAGLAGRDISPASVLLLFAILALMKPVSHVAQPYYAQLALTNVEVHWRIMGNSPWYSAPLPALKILLLCCGTSFESNGP